VTAAENVEEALVAWLVERISAVLGVDVAARPPFSPARAAYNPERRQYLSSALLSRLEPPAGHALLALVDDDLYAPGMNFVFGQADPGAGAALVSIYRLRPERYGRAPDLDLLRRRTLIECIHELGHLAGLGHCARAGCVMRFSNSLQDTDRKGPDFCLRCRQRLLRSTRFAQSED